MKILWENMRGGTKTLVIMAVLFVLAIAYGNLTGAAYRYDSTGTALGERLLSHTERGLTEIEIIAPRVDKNGVLVFNQNDPIIFDVLPGKNGVHTGATIRNAVGDLKIWGSYCSRGASADFCSNSYQCVDEEPKICERTGPKCYGDKRVTAYLPNPRTGQFVASVCDAADECNDCVEVRSVVFRIE